MAAEAPDARGLADLATAAYDDVQALREGLANFSGELEKAPSFIRAMVEKELSQTTDLTIGEWNGVLADLSRRLTSLREAAARLAAGGSAGAGERVHPEEFLPLVEDLQALRRFVDKIPGRMSLVPPLLLGPRERAEFLANIEDQSRRLAALTTALPRLAREATQLDLS